MNPEQLKMLRIVWFAHCSSILVFAVVAVLAPKSGDDPGMVGLVLPALGLASTAAQPIVGRLLASRANVFSWYVIRWALAETTALYGLVVALLGGSLAVLGGLCFLALATLAGLVPSEAGYERWVELGGRSERSAG